MCPLLSFTALPAPEKIWKQLAWWWFLQPFLCLFFGGLASSSLLLPKSAYPLTVNYKILSPQIHEFPSLSNPRLLLTSIHTHNKQLGHPLIALSLSLSLDSLRLCEYAGRLIACAWNFCVFLPPWILLEDPFTCTRNYYCVLQTQDKSLCCEWTQCQVILGEFLVLQVHFS
jgi:hypothetical protein